jgi:CheY-like chemotaxis protein
LEDITRLLSETLPKTISYSLKIDPALPSIVGDPDQLHQALLNLCVNARDAMPTGGTISFSTELLWKERISDRFAEADADRYLVLSVADTGTGISDAHRSHIFEPFFTTKERGHGTGLGLAVVYGIVKSHNGFIDFTSELGKGTSFHLYFPVVPAFTKTPERVERIVENVPGGTETILFVEDEEMLLDLLKSMFASRGYNVLTAKDGMEAVDIYRKNKYGTPQNGRTGSVSGNEAY